MLQSDFFDDETEPLIDVNIIYGEGKYITDKCMIIFSKEIYAYLLANYECEIGATKYIMFGSCGSLVVLKGGESMANMITGLRIICSIALLFFPALSTSFYALYIVAGITDMIDGTVARKTNSVSEFGSKLDTVADFILVIVCLIKLIPVLKVETWMYIWIMVIAVIKVINIISGYVMQKRLVAVHSVMNKVTGALLFALPLTLRFIELKCSVIVVCAVATFAAIQEGHFIRTGRGE